MDNASVFLVMVSFYMPGSVNKLNLLTICSKIKKAHNFTIYKNKS